MVISPRKSIVWGLCHAESIFIMPLGCARPGGERERPHRRCATSSVDTRPCCTPWQRRSLFLTRASRPLPASLAPQLPRLRGAHQLGGLDSRSVGSLTCHVPRPEPAVTRNSPDLGRPPGRREPHRPALTGPVLPPPSGGPMALAAGCFSTTSWRRCTSSCAQPRAPRPTAPRSPAADSGPPRRWPCGGSPWRPSPGLRSAAGAPWASDSARSSDRPPRPPPPSRLFLEISRASRSSKEKTWSRALGIRKPEKPSRPSRSARASCPGGPIRTRGP